MEWFIDEPRRGQTALTVIALLLATVIMWLGRRRLGLAVPSAFVLLLVAATVIPSVVPARIVAQRNACISNLRLIQDAKTRWATENAKGPSETPTEDDLYGIEDANGFLRHRVTCPLGGIYTIGRVSDNPACSFANEGHRLE
jgi:hypothetical protein